MKCTVNSSEIAGHARAPTVRTPKCVHTVWGTSVKFCFMSGLQNTVPSIDRRLEPDSETNRPDSETRVLKLGF